MSSINRPTSAQQTRRFVVLGAALFAPIVGYGQMLLGWGQTPAEFSADGDQTLRVAGYAFSIWGLIYAWLIAYGVWQVLPRTGESDLLSRMGWPSVAGMVGIGLWVIASAAGWDAATVVLIAGSGLVLVVPMLMSTQLIRAAPSRDSDRWLIAWPLGLLAGWLTIATAANVLTVLTANDALPPGLPPTGWALLAVAVVVTAALLVTWRLRLMAYPLPIAWGLMAVFVAEQERNPLLGFSALAASLLVLILALILVFRLKRDIAR
ncbi:hypothetical protein [Brevundimonas sp.]|uniref:hypothetical protein n=1 Tax=Brevundimonas sp. TaxID=1871086 RepID=UPI00391B8999